MAMRQSSSTDKITQEVRAVAVSLNDASLSANLTIDGQQAPQEFSGQNQWSGGQGGNGEMVLVFLVCGSDRRWTSSSPECWLRRTAGTIQRVESRRRPRGQLWRTRWASTVSPAVSLDRDEKTLLTRQASSMSVCRLRTA
jgi:hypothetical protein